MITATKVIDDLASLIGWLEPRQRQSPNVDCRLGTYYLFIISMNSYPQPHFEVSLATTMLW